MKVKVFVILLSLIFLFTTYSTAGVDNNISWQIAVVKLDKNNGTLLNMADSERMARRQYNDSLKRAKMINTAGMTINVMGTEKFIWYDPHTKMLLTQQKEFTPEQMRVSFENVRDSMRLTRNRLIIGLRDIYLGLYSAKNDMTIMQKKHELARKMYEQDEIRHKRGMISETDLAESDYNRLKAKAELKASKRNYDNMLRSFITYTGIEPDTTFDEIIYNEQYNEKRLKQSDYYTKKALQSRMEIVSLENQIMLLEKKLEIMDRISESLNITATRNDYKRTIADLEQLKVKAEAVRLEVEEGINEAYIMAADAEKKVIGMKKMLELQKGNIENMKERYQTGLISRTVLDQAQISYEEFKNSYDYALYDYNTTLMKLEFAAGIGPAYQEGTK